MSEEFVRCGVFATAEEIASMRLAYSTPLIQVGSRPPRDPAETVHRYALEHGLPDIIGHYGCDFRTGEFIRLPSAVADLEESG